MIRTTSSALLTLFLLAVFIPCTSANSSVDKGQQLFTSKELGTNGKACSTCHPDGKGLENIGDYDQTMLKEIINFCIRDALKGQMLPADSSELIALEAYLRRFQHGDPQ